MQQSLPGSIAPSKSSVKRYFPCQKCGKRLKAAPFSAATRLFRCPFCGQVFSLSGGTGGRQPRIRGAGCQPAWRTAGWQPAPRIPWFSVLAAAIAFWVGLSLGHHDAITRDPPAKGFDASGWKEYPFDKAGLKISLPSAPEIGSASAEERSCVLIVRSELAATDLEFCLHVFSAKGAPAKLADVEKGVLADYPGATVKSSRSFHWGGALTMEFGLEWPAGQARRRIVRGKDKTFVLSVAGNDLARHDQSIQHFFHSLQVEEPAAPPGEVLRAPRVAGP